jgi:hypothetical protein
MNRRNAGLQACFHFGLSPDIPRHDAARTSGLVPRRANVAWKNAPSGHCFDGRVDSSRAKAGVINNRLPG